MKANLRHIYLGRTANMSWRTCVVKQIQSNPIHLWIQTGVTVQKRPIWVKIGESFCPLWPWHLTYDLEKQQDTSSMLLQALCIISSQYVNSNWSYNPETAKLTFDLCDLDLWPWPFAWISLLSLLITPENFMIRWQEHSEKGVTDGRRGRRKEVFLELFGRS